MDGLLLEDVPLNAIADAAGTPTWVISAGCLRTRLAALQDALAGLAARVHYAVKANDHLAVLRLMAQGGAGRRRGQRRRTAPRPAGRHPARPHRVLRRRQGRVGDAARARRPASARSTSRAPRSWRCSPAVAARHGPDRAGRAAHQPGRRSPAPTPRSPPAGPRTSSASPTTRRPRSMPMPPGCRGSSRSGSRCISAARSSPWRPYRAAYRPRRRARPRPCARAGHTVRIGGLRRRPRHRLSRRAGAAARGVRRRHRAAPSPALTSSWRSSPAAGWPRPAGLLLTSVVLVKTTGARRFVVLDAAMNDLLRPAMYEAWHGIVPVAAARRGQPGLPGRHRRAGLRDRRHFCACARLPPLRPGARMAILDAGAYGSVMSSTYNARPLAAEILVDGASWSVIRERQTLEALWAGETHPGLAALTAEPDRRRLARKRAAGARGPLVRAALARGLARPGRARRLCLPRPARRARPCCRPGRG